MISKILKEKKEKKINGVVRSVNLGMYNLLSKNRASQSQTVCEKGKALTEVE